MLADGKAKDSEHTHSNPPQFFRNFFTNEVIIWRYILKYVTLCRLVSTAYHLIQRNIPEDLNIL